MKDILLQAMNNCAKRYSKGIPRYEHLWDDKLTIEQKSTEISKELESMGYVLLRAIHKPQSTYTRCDMCGHQNEEICNTCEVWDEKPDKKENLITTHREE